jgi:hypothetical protein
MTFRSEGSFACHTCYDTEPRFIRTGVEARKDSHRIMTGGHSSSSNDPLAVEKLDNSVEERPGGHYLARHT